MAARIRHPHPPCSQRRGWHGCIRISLKGAPTPVLDGFTGEQRFYLGWARVWRTIQRDEIVRLIVTSDFHSPAECRANEIVRNMHGWYEAFQMQPDSKLHLKPEDRVRIW